MSTLQEVKARTKALMEAAGVNFERQAMIEVLKSKISLSSTAADILKELKSLEDAGLEGITLNELVGRLQQRRSKGAGGGSKASKSDSLTPMQVQQILMLAKEADTNSFEVIQKNWTEGEEAPDGRSIKRVLRANGLLKDEAPNSKTRRAAKKN